MKYKTCNECGVPEAIGKYYVWNPDGTITAKDDPDRRMVIFETENLTMLFRYLEETTEIPIDVIITEAKRKSTLPPTRQMSSDFRVQVMQVLGMHPVFRKFAEQGCVLGLGGIELGKITRLRRAEVEVSWPYSLPMSLGDFTASAQVSLRGPVKTEWEAVGERKYVFRATASHLEKVPDERIQKPVPPRLPGDMEFKSCSACEVPLEIARYQWDLEKGIITDPLNAHRVAFLQAWEIENVLRELERELGETVIQLFVSAQRDFLMSTVTKDQARMSSEGYKRLLALRGFGFLREFNLDSNMMRMRVDNPAFPSLLAGSFSAFYELITGDHGDVRWSLEGENSLLVETERTSGTII